MSIGLGIFPSVQNARKQLVKNADVNSTHPIEVSVKYVCEEGYFYTLDNPIVSCTNGVFDNKVGTCVKVEIL